MFPEQVARVPGDLQARQRLFVGGSDDRYLPVT